MFPPNKRIVYVVAELTKRLRTFIPTGRARPPLAGYNVTTAPADASRDDLIRLVGETPGAVVISVIGRAWGKPGGGKGARPEPRTIRLRLTVLVRDLSAQATRTQRADLSPVEAAELAAIGSVGTCGAYLLAPTEDNFAFSQGGVTAYRVEITGETAEGLAS